MYDPEMNIPQPIAPQAWYQLGVIVIDGSGSMTLPYAGDEEVGLGGGAVRTKAEATEGALKSFVTRMQRSHNAPNFGLSFVFFNDSVTHERKPAVVPELDPNASYDSTAYGIGGTAIHSGLDAAASIIETFMHEGAALEVPLSAVVVLMSDGEDRDDPIKTAASAKRIKGLPKTKLTSCLFATQGQPAVGESLLQEVASAPEFYQRAYSTEQLRKFFEASMTTVGRELIGPAE
jgi:von Willebrand factor type A domain